MRQVFCGGVLCVALLTGACGAAWATDYYVGRAGDDGNAGTSPEAAWKSLAPVNAKQFAPGDRILFETGSRYTEQLKPQGSGAEGKPIAIDKYGEGPLPRFDGEGKYVATVHLYNVEHWEVNNLEITNSIPEPKDGRLNGLLVELKDFGPAHHIHLGNLYVHDVSGMPYSDPNGKGGHGSNSGDGIAVRNAGEAKASHLDDFLIEGCRIARTHLNGIWIGNEQWHWKPRPNHLKVVVRNNRLEDIGMSAIVMCGSEAPLAEYNRIAGAGLGRDGGIGIWPWSSDNTIVQFNEVSGCDGTHDGKAFDSDYNCRNTIFQYNYSHDNPGGFVMFCTPSLNDFNVGCEGTIVRYNISENDGGTVPHVFSFGGPCKNTYIYNNTIHVRPGLDLHLIDHGDWQGYADKTYFFNNVVYADGRLSFNFTQSTNNVFGNNAWHGHIVDPPENPNGVSVDPQLAKPGSGGNLDEPHKLATLDGYRLTASSPVIDKGADLKALLGVEMGSRDYFGNKIPAGGGYDIGAHECSTDEDPNAKAGEGAP